jgi:hypothetical protein
MKSLGLRQVMGLLSDTTLPFLSLRYKEEDVGGKSGSRKHTLLALHRFSISLMVAESSPKLSFLALLSSLPMRTLSSSSSLSTAAGSGSAKDQVYLDGVVRYGASAVA